MTLTTTDHDAGLDRLIAASFSAGAQCGVLEVDRETRRDLSASRGNDAESEGGMNKFDQAMKIMRDVAKKHGYAPTQTARGDVRLRKGKRLVGFIVCAPSIENPEIPSPIASRYVAWSIEDVRGDMNDALVAAGLLSRAA